MANVEGSRLVDLCSNLIPLVVKVLEYELLDLHQTADILSIRRVEE